MAGNLLRKPNQIIIPDSVYQGSLIEYQGKHVSPIYIHPTGIVWYTQTHTQTLITVVVIGYIIGLRVHPKIGKVYGLMVAGRQWLQSKRLQIISAFFFRNEDRFHSAYFISCSRTNHQTLQCLNDLSSDLTILKEV